jgi:predicted exporter
VGRCGVITEAVCGVGCIGLTHRTHTHTLTQLPRFCYISTTASAALAVLCPLPQQLTAAPAPPSRRHSNRALNFKARTAQQLKRLRLLTTALVVRQLLHHGFFLKAV